MTEVAITFLILYVLALALWWFEARAHEKTKRQLGTATGEVFEYEHLVGMQRDFLLRQQAIISAVTDDHVLQEVARLQREFVEEGGKKWVH